MTWQATAANPVGHQQDHHDPAAVHRGHRPQSDGDRPGNRPADLHHPPTGCLTGQLPATRPFPGRPVPAGPTLRIIETGIPVAALTLAERAPSVIEDLCTASKNRVRLGVLTQPHVTYIEKTPGDQPATSFDRCATVPAHLTAMGRALLAFAPVRTVESLILCGLRPYTGHPLTSPDRVPRPLAVTRLTRVAVSRGEFESGRVHGRCARGRPHRTR